MNRSRFSKAVSMFVTTVIAMSGLPSMVLADVINAPTYHSVTDGLEFEVTENVTSGWSGHSNVEYTFTNTGNETIHNWFFTFNVDASIDNIWNAAIYETDGSGTYTITSNGWNQDILPGKSVTIGMSLSSDIEEIDSTPSWYLLNTSATTVATEDYTVSYTEYSSWESGFTGQITLEPEVDCTHWSLTFDSNREITAVSSAVLKTVDESRYEITHDENNMRLIANNAYNFGVQGLPTEEDLEFLNTELIVINLAYHLTDDTNANGILDYQEAVGGGSITPTPTPTPTEEPTPTEDPTEIPTEEPTIEPTVTDVPTNTEEPTEIPTETVTPTATPTPIEDMESDRDGDGLPDYVEEEIGTDPLKADTDDDGLSDYTEIVIGYNPINPDTDGNGVSDANEDFDNDGLSNLTEVLLGIGITREDTDGDEIPDGDEVNIYGTNPLIADTDDDGIFDGDEIFLGKNPLDGSDGTTRIEQTVNKTIENNEDPAITSVTVTTSVAGNISRVLYIRDYYNVDIYSTDVYGRIGSPINFECSEEFDSATVVINYNDSQLGNTSEDNLGVLWYDEENGIYVIQDQVVVDTQNNTIALTLNHFSTYVVVDLEMWNNPVIPDYSDYIHNIHYETVVRVIGSVATADKRADSYWRLSGYYHNYLCISTVNADCTHIEGMEWNYSYDWSVIDLTDNDEDGVPDFIEINGVYTPSGEIYTTSIEKEDTDGDLLTDFEEYGSIYFVNRCSDKDEIIVSRWKDGRIVGFEDNSVLYWYLHSYIGAFVASDRTVAVCVPFSNPEIDDTDGDCANDSVDKTPFRFNGTINYILVGLDKDNEDSLSSMVQPYVNEFQNIGEEVIVLNVYKGSDYDLRLKNSGILLQYTYNIVQYTLNHLQCDLGSDIISGKIAYRKVNIAVIIAHGQPGWLQFAPETDEDDVILNTSDISRLNIEIPINILDVQACYCGVIMSGEENDGTCVALEFFNLPSIETVYAWTGRTSFLDIGVNCSDNGYYEKIYQNGNEITVDRIGSICGILEY